MSNAKCASFLCHTPRCCASQEATLVIALITFSLRLDARRRNSSLQQCVCFIMIMRMRAHQREMCPGAFYCLSAGPPVKWGRFFFAFLLKGVIFRA